MIVSRKSYTPPGIDSCLYLSAKSLKVNPAVGAKNRVLTRSKTIHMPRLDPQAEDEAVKEHCGIVGIYSLKGEPVAERIVKGLSALQHRGQESWGIAVPSEPIIKGLGLIGIGAATNARKILRLEANRGIGHVRYSTRGRTNLDNASPMDIKGEFSIAQNGTVANTEDVTPLVTGEFPILDDSNDTRLAGYRLLCLGYDEETKTHIIASESCALTALHADFVQDVQPGELVRLNQDGVTVTRFVESSRHYHCPFEYTYFAPPSSDIEGHNVYETRRQLGKVLARKYPFKADVVIPVPDSARPAALGYSEESGIPMEEGSLPEKGEPSKLHRTNRRE